LIASAWALRQAAPANWSSPARSRWNRDHIADEPVSSLDASVRGEILALLLSLRDELGLTVLVVTHDLGLAWNIADRLAVMYLGRIVESGPTEKVLAAPRHPYTAALLSVLPESTHRAPVILTGETPDPRRIPTGCRFHPRCPALAEGIAAAKIDGARRRCRCWRRAAGTPPPAC
jgi:peptide/nickel transport system ATP-binding protein